VQDSGEDTLSGHYAVAHLLIYLTVTVTLLADLCHFKDHITDLKYSSDRQFTETEAFNHKVLSERSECHIRASGSEFLYLSKPEQAYLSVPFSCMGITLDKLFGLALENILD